MALIATTAFRHESRMLWDDSSVTSVESRHKAAIALAALDAAALIVSAWFLLASVPVTPLSPFESLGWLPPALLIVLCALGFQVLVRMDKDQRRQGEGRVLGITTVLLAGPICFYVLLTIVLTTAPPFP
jgi:hypothetical protein